MSVTDEPCPTDRATTRSITPEAALTRLATAALHFLLPAACLACGAETPRPQAGLCGPCRALLEPPRPGCSVCGEELPRAAALPPSWRCGACRDRPPAYARLVAAWRYAGPLPAVVGGFKYRGLEALARPLAKDLARRLADSGDSAPGSETEPAPPDLVVPVPLHWRRRLGRGYDQAEVLAVHLARCLRLPWRRALRRRRATRPQTGLDRRARRANLRRAFALRHRAAARPEGIEGRHILLVDDVATTGATLDAAAGTLRHGGAATVWAVAVGRTPPEPGGKLGGERTGPGRHVEQRTRQRAGQ